MIRKEELYQIGYFTKPHGIKGELSLNTEYNELLEDVEIQYLICHLDGLFVPFYIESIRKKNNSVLLVKFENVNDEYLARKFSNTTVFYPLKYLRNIPAEIQPWNTFLNYNLHDCQVGYLGKIKEIDTSTINTLFIVDYGEKDLLVPVTTDLILSVNYEEQVVKVNLPEGLIDL